MDTNQPDSVLRVNGRRFSPETTLLVRAPFALKEPFSVQLVFQANSLNGTLLFYQLAPSRQEQMLVENPTGQQFFLAIVNGQIELRYVSNGPAGRTLSVRSMQQLKLGLQHTLRAGVAQGRPWIKLDMDPETTASEIEERRHEASLSSSLSTGGHGTIVIGRQVMVSPTRYAQPIVEGTVGFSGCLLQLSLRTESPLQEQHVDLISGDSTELAWIGVDRLPSGLAEAPLCRPTTDSSIVSTNQEDQQTVQLDAGRRTSLCDRQPCLNGGTCELTSDVGYICICSPGWQGHHCDQGVILLIPPSMRFATQNTGPFISVYVDAKGYLFVQCRVGHPVSEDRVEFLHQQPQSRLITFRYSAPVQLNRWHTLIVEKRTRALDVQLNDGPKERVRTVPENFRRLPRNIRQQLSAFDLSESPIYVGGFSPNDRSVPSIPVSRGMRGALQKLNINGAEVVLAGPISPNPAESGPVEPTELWSRVTQWQGPPCGPNHSPCSPDKPESICRPLGSEATCACSTPLQLWKLLREKLDNVEDAERNACNQRQNEMNKARVRMLADRPSSDERLNERVQYDGLPGPNSDSTFDDVIKSNQMMDLNDFTNQFTEIKLNLWKLEDEIFSSITEQ
ncbi:unnamed protein product [Echinostoma caproni]|uniref:EGF-like domain-containing protein n=1 Tax=Echinostoma caproni TaxID=27848 RepID=A0A3P8KMV4_9TREM|nr:unnamed protein product [Echinostoma caproni]